MIAELIKWLILQCIATLQERIIFKPHVRQIEPLYSPDHYGLEDTQSVTIETADHITLELWYHPAKGNAPLFICFHGNTGHFGDVGPPTADEIYDRRYRLTLLREISTHNAGFIAMHMRGYGSHKGTPSEAGFSHDLTALCDYIEQHKLHHHPLIILGESLGAANALTLTSLLHQRHIFPKITGCIAAFTSITDKAIERYPTLDHSKMAAKLRHHFNNMQTITTLAPGRPLVFFVPENDNTTPPHHSQSLHEKAVQLGLSSRLITLPNAEHITWNAQEIIAPLIDC